MSDTQPPADPHTDYAQIWHELSGFQRSLLQAIAAHHDTNTAPYGLALKEWLDERYPTHINHSRLYQNLDTLIENDLVTRSPLDDRTNRYDLTPRAHRLLAYQTQTLAELTDSLPGGAEQ